MAHAAAEQFPQEAQQGADADPFDDVFGAGEGSPTAHEGVHSASHPSDMPRLQTEHTTAGYREGLTAAKATSVQAGFDEGFSLGATLGLRAGQLSGMLEGIAEALRGQDEEASRRADGLLAEAQRELGPGRIFSSDYWAPDGNWSYDVESREGEEILFADVAAAHPLIRKWTETVDEEMALWKVDKSILDDETGIRLDAVPNEPISSSTPPTVQRPLDW